MATSLENMTIRLKIRRELDRGRKKFIIYPFGELGQLCKKILNNEFQIEECFCLDNNINEEGVYLVEILRDFVWKDEYVLVASSNLTLHNEIRAELKKNVPQDRIVDLFAEKNIYQSWKKYITYMAEISGFDFESNIFMSKKYNVKFYLPFWETDLIQQYILLQDKYYEDQLLFRIKHVFGGGVALDIGANIGNHSIYFLKECNVKKVIAFEPVKQTFNILKRNIEINELQDNVILYNYGLGEMHSKARIVNYDLCNIGGTMLQNDENGGIEIFSLDELELDEDIQFIKIDVEGFEEKVIRGALRTIEKNKPVMLIEAWDRSDTIYNIIKLLVPYGYDFQYIYEENYIFYCR